MKALLTIFIGSLMLFVFSDRCRADNWGLERSSSYRVRSTDDYQDEQLRLEREQIKLQRQELLQDQARDRDAFYDRQFEDFKEAIEPYRPDR